MVARNLLSSYSHSSALPCLAQGPHDGLPASHFCMSAEKQRGQGASKKPRESFMSAVCRDRTQFDTDGLRQTPSTTDRCACQTTGNARECASGDNKKRPHGCVPKPVCTDRVERMRGEGHVGRPESTGEDKTQGGRRSARVVAFQKHRVGSGAVG
jgi:hypothetical protein